MYVQLSAHECSQLINSFFSCSCQHKLMPMMKLNLGEKYKYVISSLPLDRQPD